VAPGIRICDARPLTILDGARRDLHFDLGGARSQRVVEVNRGEPAIVWLRRVAAASGA
jgi:hypothetical protein